MSNASKIALVIIAALGWFALIVQFILMVGLHVTALPETIIRFFSFFTILTNLLVAVYSTSLVLQPSSSWGKFFGRSSVGSATAVYIVVVGLIYNTILRFLWQPVGMQRIVDELLHSVIPLFFLAYWFFFVPKKELQWSSFLPWLIYPFVYCLYILVRGSFSRFYPYPFMDVTKLGLTQVLFNSVGVTLVFLSFSLLFIGIGKIKK